jgi:eukaryotic-like serine/threonine-protein kinase
LKLLGESPVSIKSWCDLLFPVREDLLPSLTLVLRERDGSEKSLNAAFVLGEYFSDRPDLLADLLWESDARQAGHLARAMRTQGYRVERRLLGMLSGQLPEDGHLKSGDERARGRANAALVLIALGDKERWWTVLERTDDLQTRTDLIHGMMPAGVSSTEIVERIGRSKSQGVLQALILALGEYDIDSLAPSRRTEVVRQLTAIYREHADAGVHSSIEWLLRRWGQDEVLDCNDQWLAMGPLDPSRNWYVGPMGHSFSIIPAQTNFITSAEEPRLRKQVIIERSFAIATKETTFGQYKRLMQNTSKSIPHDNRPAAPLTLFDSMRYCRWLSEQAGIPETQMCYPSSAEIVPGMTLPGDYLLREGYRLPTEEEWECACRAGSITPRFYGEDPESLRFYARYFLNSDDHTWSVGGLKPNDLGLFDIYGNAAEWCTERNPNGEGGSVQAVTIGKQSVHVVRGGSCVSRQQALLSSRRVVTYSGSNLIVNGFRVARTIR